MFSSEVSHAVRSFETQTLQPNGHPYYPNARITLTIPGFTRAHAICALFKLCNPSSKEYDFIARRQEGNRENSEITLFTHSSKAGELVNVEFMNALKSTIRSFSATLGSSWVPYTITKDDASFSFNDIDEEETVMSKDALEESLHIYSYLSDQSGCKIKCDQIDGDVTGKYLDLIAGSKSDVEQCVAYFKKIGESMQNEIK
jgi:hypothetical protein